MRAILPWFLLASFSLPLFAGDKEKADEPLDLAVETVTPAPTRPMPWIGLEIRDLDEATRAHASGVPEGVGFLIKGVADCGPAKKAGMRRYDVLWKLDDQLLVNEAQFATLLKLRQVGDEVKLSVFRCGRQHELSLVLAESPRGAKIDGISPADLPLIPPGVPGIPQVRVTPHDRTAELTKADGSSAKLFYKGDVAHVTILGADQKLIYEGPVRGEDGFAVPEDWSHSIGAMFRSLYKANNPSWKPRRPRPRVVLPTDQVER
ncbi:PDZ domain-containing protein [Haloferula chungangensis]|uniref:PDZ domain-containing protein n=1 Tax=Haloferula chungangensis TaxID=1048331 RepID=A0ABW2KZU3_9BACT